MNLFKSFATNQITEILQNAKAFAQGQRQSQAYDHSCIFLKNKRAMMAMDHSPESFSPQMNSTSLLLWFKLVTPGVGPVLIPTGII